MSSRPTVVSCRPHPEINEKLEQLADKRRTTKARLLEEWIKEKLDEEMGHESGESGGSLPHGVYVPDSEKHSYAVKFEKNGKTRRKYYKTREGAERRAEHERTLSV